MTRDFLLSQHPDGVINIVDATNIERNLYLTLQLAELMIPTVLALNMMDEVQANHGRIDIALLEQELGLPVVPISAIKRQGLGELVARAAETVKNRQKPARVDFCAGPVHRSIHAVTHMIEDHAQAAGIPARFAATKLLEGDGPMQTRLNLTQNELDMIEHSVHEMETELHTDREAAMADMRYKFIEDVTARCVTKTGPSREYKRSVSLDAVLTHKVLALPAFLALMLLVFWLTFEVIGTPLSDILTGALDFLAEHADGTLTAYGLNPVAKSLLIDGVFAGVGAVLSFVPVIVTLFFFLSIMEDSGYLARVAFVMDRPLRRIGLSGRSVVPLLMGFGCSVPAIMAARTLSGARDKRLTILLVPFMSCSAKLPIYALFASALFPDHAALVMSGLYLLGIALAVVTALALKRTAFKGGAAPFMMELPNYRFPSAKTVLRLCWDKAKDFCQRAFTVIFLATLVIWFLQTFDPRLNVAASGGDSILAIVGRLVSGVFAPAGFGGWQVSTALITGFMAKEAVISTLAVLTGVGLAELGGALAGMFTTASALAFLAFVLLYTPCVAAVAAIKRELNSLWGAAAVAAYQTLFAWLVSVGVYQLLRLFGVE